MDTDAGRLMPKVADLPTQENPDLVQSSFVAVYVGGS